MVTNGGNTEGLFRGGIMHAGSPLPTGDIESIQPAYDIVVEQAGCAAAADTLECLRQVPAATLLKAGAVLPNLFDLPVSIRLSGVSLQNMSLMFWDGRDWLRYGPRAPMVSFWKRPRNTWCWQEAWRISPSSPVSIKHACAW